MNPQETGRRTGLMVLAWAWVGLPFTYGVYELFLKLTQLFAG
ncbi:MULTISPECIES: MFS transporter small subunit [unclassified Nonomuraea]